MATLSIPDIIRIGDVSTYKASNYQSRQQLYGGTLSPVNDVHIAYTTDALRWGYEGGQDAGNVRALANYLIWLCGRFYLEAKAVIDGVGGGTVQVASNVVGTFEYLIPVTASQFYNATEYRSTKIVGKQLEVFWNNVDRYLESPLKENPEFTYTVNGINILVPGFDATGDNADADFKIYIVNPGINTSGGSSGSSSNDGTPIAFDGDGSYTIAENTALDRILILPSVSADIKIGFTAGADDVMPEQTISSSGQFVTLDLFSLGGVTIYFTGVPASSVITFFTSNPNITP